MKVMIVTPYFAPKIGGLENYALNIAKGLQKKGDDVFVVTSNHLSKERVEETVEGLRVIRLPVTFKFSNTPVGLLWYWQLKKVIRSEKPDIINAHAPVPGMADFAIHASNKLGVKSVLTYHAATLKKEGSLLFNVVARMYSILHGPTFKKADGIFAVSDYVKDCLKPELHAKTSVVYNGVNLEEVPSVSTNKKPNRLVFVGSLDKSHSWKGLHEILHAIAILKNQGRTIELDVLGDGNFRMGYQDEARELGILNQVNFHGFVKGNKKYQHIASAVALVAYPTTENDAFPTVFLEAWACGTPVISSSIGAINGIIDDGINGFLAKPGDPEKLADKIDKAVDDEESLKRVALKGRELVETRYEWKVIAQQAHNIFDEMTQGQASKVPRILRIVSSGYEQGGVENGIVISNSLLRKAGFEVRVLSSDAKPEKEHFSNYEFKQIPETRIRKILYTVWNPSAYKTLKAVLKEYNPDVVMLHTMMQPSASILFLLRNTKTVACVHGPEIFTSELIPWLLPLSDYQDGVISKDRMTIVGKIHYVYFRYVCGTLYKIGLRNVDRFIAFSNYTQKMLRTDGIESTYIKNGIKVLDYSEPQNRNVLIYAGRLEKFKGVDDLIHAMPLISKKVSGAKLLIAGDGSYKENLVNLVQELKLQNCVKFIGHLDQAGMSNFYKNSAITVMPSTWPETFGKVGVEAMSVGRPVVATDVGGVSDWLKDGINGILVESQNPEQLSAAIISILSDDKKYIRMSKEARSVSKKFSVDHLAASYVDTFKLMLEEKRA